MSKLKRGMRYHNAEEDVIKLSANGVVMNAIIVNESHTGIACVYVGSSLKLDDPLIWLEAENIKTNCQIIRCEPLKENITFLAFEYSENR